MPGKIARRFIDASSRAWKRMYIFKEGGDKPSELVSLRAGILEALHGSVAAVKSRAHHDPFKGSRDIRPLILISECCF